MNITKNTDNEHIKDIITNNNEFIFVKNENSKRFELLFKVIKLEDKIIITSKIISTKNLNSLMSNDYENLKFTMNLKDNTAYLDTVNKIEGEFSGS